MARMGERRRPHLGGRMTMLLACTIGLAACDVPKSMHVRTGVDPKYEDDDVRFRTTYFFRVFDACYAGGPVPASRQDSVFGGRPENLPLTLRFDSLYRFRMTGKANSLFNKIHFESGTLHKSQIDPFGNSVRFDQTNNNFRVVTREETEEKARRDERYQEIERLIRLKVTMAGGVAGSDRRIDGLINEFLLTLSPSNSGSLGSGAIASARQQVQDSTKLKDEASSLKANAEKLKTDYEKLKSQVALPITESRGRRDKSFNDARGALDKFDADSLESHSKAVLSEMKQATDILKDVKPAELDENAKAIHDLAEGARQTADRANSTAKVLKTNFPSSKRTIGTAITLPAAPGIGPSESDFGEAVVEIGKTETTFGLLTADTNPGTSKIKALKELIDKAVANATSKAKAADQKRATTETAENDLAAAEKTAGKKEDSEDLTKAKAASKAAKDASTQLDNVRDRLIAAQKRIEEANKVITTDLGASLKQARDAIADTRAKVRQAGFEQSILAALIDLEKYAGEASTAMDNATKIGSSLAALTNKADTTKTNVASYLADLSKATAEFEKIMQAPVGQNPDSVAAAISDAAKAGVKLAASATDQANQASKTALELSGTVVEKAANAADAARRATAAAVDAKWTTRSVENVASLAADLERRAASMADIAGREARATQILADTAGRPLSFSIAGAGSASSGIGGSSSPPSSACPPGTVGRRGFQILGPEGWRTFDQDERLIMAMSSSAKPLIGVIQEISSRTLAPRLNQSGQLLPLVTERLRLSEAQRKLDAFRSTPPATVTEAVENVLKAFDPDNARTPSSPGVAP